MMVVQKGIFINHSPVSKHDPHTAGEFLWLNQNVAVKNATVRYLLISTNTASCVGLASTW
jgi:hypothetical protein